MSRRDWSTSNWLRCSTGAVLTATPITMSAWGNTSLLATVQVIVGCYNSTGAGASFNLFRMGVGSSNNIFARTGDATTSDAATTVGAILANVWFHACGVFASATDRRAFINYGQGGDKATNAVSHVPSGIDRTSIGAADGTSPLTPFGVGGTGDLAEIAIWNTALSDAEVARLATGISAIAVRRESLVAYWPLLYGGGNEVNVANPTAAQVVQGALTMGATPPKVFMPKLPVFLKAAR